MRVCSPPPTTTTTTSRLTYELGLLVRLSFAPHARLPPHVPDSLRPPPAPPPATTFSTTKCQRPW